MTTEPRQATGNAHAGHAEVTGNADRDGAHPASSEPTFGARRGARWKRLGAEGDKIAARHAARDAELEPRVARVEKVLAEAGALRRDELANRVEAGSWGPSAFGQVLRAGSRQERIVYRDGMYYSDYAHAEAPGRGRKQG